jgi:lysophospholipase L1-like esterase
MNRAALIATAVACAAPAAHAQDFLSVPYVVTSDPSLFRTIFSRARTGPGLHTLMIGDSQETSPLGPGANYVGCFNAEWARRCGVAPRTPLVQPGLTFGAPDGEWLVAGENFNPLVTSPSALFPADALPGLANWVLPAPTGAQRGWAMVLQTHATGLLPDAPLDPSRAWLDVSQGVYLDVYALRDAGPLSVSCTLVPSDSPSQSGVPLATFVADPGTAPDTGPVARVRLGPVSWNSTANPAASIQAEFVGANPAVPARMVSASFVSVASDRGLTATDIAAGGYDATSLTAIHRDALPHLRALDVDMAILCFGANDVWYAPQHFKLNLTTLIATLRQNTRPDLPILLLIDPYRGWITPTTEAWAEQFPRMCAELAAELPAVCAVNSRLLTHERGWTAEHILDFTIDRVHFNPNGAALRAELEVSTLWNQFVCAADIGSPGGLMGADGRLDNNDFIVFISAFFNHQPLADMGKSGGEPGADGLYDNNDFIVFISAFFAGCN